MQTEQPFPFALAAKVVTAKAGAAPALLLVASRAGRGEPSLVISDDSPIIWEGEDGIKEFLCVPPDIEREIMRRIRTDGLLVFDAKEVIQHGVNTPPLTLLKI